MAVETYIERLKRWQSDFPAYAREALRIVTKDGEFIPFELNRGQQRMWKLIKKKMDAGKPVRIYVLKARQIGFSTLIQAILFWRVSLRRYQTALTVSHDTQSAEALFNKSKVYYQSLPNEAKPERKISNRRELTFAVDDQKRPDEMGLQSRIMVQTAADKHLGASLTLQAVHLSEFARYDKVNPQPHLAYATLMQAVPHKPNTFVFIETTAHGLGIGYEFWNKEDSGYENLFISWCAADEYRSAEALSPDELYDFADSPYGDERQVMEDVISELAFWYETEALEPGWLEEEALHRMKWRRELINTNFNGRLDLFRQEFPITAQEAFLTSGVGVFDNRKLADIRNGCPDPTEYRFDLASGSFTQARYGDLRMWEAPREGVRYVMGVDVSEGLREHDNSAVQVLRVEKGQLIQVAVWQGLIPPDDLADLVNALGRWYNSAFVAIEMNGPGYATNLRLQKRLFYPAIYLRTTYDSLTRAYTSKVGWNTNAKTKQIMVSDLRQAVDTDLIVFQDAATLEEMGYYQMSDDGKYDAAAGYHDDLVMSIALAIQMADQQGYAKPSEGRAIRPPKGSFEWHAQEYDKAQLVQEEVQPWTREFSPNDW